MHQRGLVPPRFNISGFTLRGQSGMHAVMRLMQESVSISYMLGYRDGFPSQEGHAGWIDRPLPRSEEESLSPTRHNIGWKWSFRALFNPTKRESLQ